MPDHDRLPIGTNRKSPAGLPLATGIGKSMRIQLSIIFMAQIFIQILIAGIFL